MMITAQGSGRADSQTRGTEIWVREFCLSQESGDVCLDLKDP